ncbi:hypothetical protein QS306_03695 [Paraburkholderia bonniea]|uniref:hypothetical protein n=1 Tax=Paraburkholderia bonniea TaxID=2152891 RepID=UPI001291602D|nr:hypothetical protein [Paraburkholderia bonniea]WJF90779.1 hypothetical protein QS306_03695 [Paraburkholderia bonniea]WJF94093.1 hypothetical protein QS308_03695 [Paraburkholderia bonniea]
MDRTENLLQLAVRLREATLSRNFRALTVINREVQAVVAGVACKPVMNDSERQALALVKIAHKSAVALLVSESGRLVNEMVGLSERREGMQAYALHAASEEDQT